MFDDLVAWIANYPYPAVALVFVVCGLGLPIPEELILIAAGYVCATYPLKATLPLMIVWSGSAILLGDLLPFVLGRVFGTRLLRLRWMRLLITKRRLARFDSFFRQRGDLVIFIARFLAGIRVVAFFTAGTMKMPIRRFLAFDCLGIVLIVPLLSWIGYHFHEVIDGAIERVQSVERGLLWTVLATLLLGGIWLWRRRPGRKSSTPDETFLEPQMPVVDPTDNDPDNSIVSMVDLPDLEDPRQLEQDEPKTKQAQKNH
ncbi:membrane protein [Planctomycetota bacterium]|nr:membrane protein [Planctomycetota bacterium]